MSNIEQAKWLSEFYKQVAEGGEMRQKGDWAVARPGPDMNSNPEYWRVVMPTVLTPVDMSVLVDSGIDCEFWDQGSDQSPQLSWLRGVDINNEFVAFDCIPSTRCQPRMNYWFSARNFEAVNLLLAELNDAGFALDLAFVGEGKTFGADVEAFQITGIAEGRCWPWEQGNGD